jgi:hypothetical protein
MSNHSTSSLPFPTLALSSTTAYIVAVLAMAILGATAFFAIRLWTNAKKRRDAARFGQDLDDGLGDDGGRDKAEQEEMRKKLLEGIQQYEKSGLNVYESPWLVLVGPPSAGKSVLLQKCGLVDQADALKGVGGTRGMNWWFVDADVGGDEPIHAVVLDMAGAVFMDQRQEGRWDTFLDFLRQHRRYEPLNGVLLVVSVQDLLGKTPEQLTDEAGKVRAQLERIRTKLDVRFPVWIIVTKCDLIDGFKEFFDTIKDPGVAAQMLGWSKPGSLDEPFSPKQVREYIGTIVARMRKYRLKSLADMVTGPEIGVRQTDRADALYGLPVTFDDLGGQLEKYLEVVFARKKVSTAPPFMRGIYFTSSERKGASISKALRELGIPPVDEQWPDRAFFNKDVFSQKIFQETMLVTPVQNVDRMRRKRRLMAYGTGIAAALVLGGATVLSWFALSKGVNSVSTFYSQLAQPAAWEKVLAASKTGESISNLQLPNKDGATVADIPQLAEASQVWATETPSTPLIFKPLTLLIGAADMPNIRRAVHDRLMRDAVVRPLLDKTYVALHAENAFVVNTPADLDRFNRAASALEEFVRFNRAVALRGASSANSGRSPSSEPVVNLRPLLELLAKDSHDKVAAAWLENKSDDTLQFALTGVPKTATRADELDRSSRYATLKDASNAELLAIDDWDRKTFTLLDDFRKAIQAQANGDSGVLRMLKDLQMALAGAEAARNGLDGVTRKSVLTLDDYNQFASNWRDNANKLKSNSDSAARIAAELNVAKAELDRKLSAVPSSIKSRYETLNELLAKPSENRTNIPEMLASWQARFSGQDKRPDFDGFSKRTLEAVGEVRDQYAMVSEPAGEQSALVRTVELAAKVSDTLSGDLQEQMKGLVNAKPLAWNSKSVDAAAVRLVEPLAEKSTELRAQSSKWLPPSTGGGGTFVTQLADSCDRAGDIIRRRAIGVELDRFLSEIAQRGAALPDALRDARLSEVKNVDPPPLSRMAAEDQPQIRGHLTATAVGSFFEGWNLAQAALGTDPHSSGINAPIVDKLAFEQRRDAIVGGIDRYRAQTRTFWETELPAALNAADATETWPQFLRNLKQVNDAGAETLNRHLSELGESRSRIVQLMDLKDVKTDADWSMVSASQLADITAKSQSWLAFWTALPEDSLAARDALRAQIGKSPETLVLTRAPYWESLAARAARALKSSVEQGMRDECEQLRRMTAFPIVKNNTTEVVLPSEMKKAQELLCQMEARTEAAPIKLGESPGLVLAEFLTTLNKTNTDCSVPTNACGVARALALPVAVTVQPAPPVQGATAEPVQREFPRLSVTTVRPQAARFKDADDGFESPGVAAGVAWKFQNDDQSITITFTNEWYLVGLIARYGKKQADGTWLVEIPSLRAARDLLQIAPSGKDYSLSLKIVLKGDVMLPSESEWPRAK